MVDPVKKSQGEVVLHGIGVSPGVVSGPVFLFSPNIVNIVEKELNAAEVDGEIARFEKALIQTRSQIKRIQKDLESKTALSDASILDAHLMVVDDRMFIEQVIHGIRDKRRNAEAVIQRVTEQYAAVLAEVNDDYLRERVADVKDVARRIIRNISGDVDTGLADLQHKHIIVAVDLAPSDTAALRKDMVVGFAIDLGSPTSHTAVMARALEIPAIVGLHDVSKKVVSGDEVLIDGNKGVFIINPSAGELEKYGKVAETRRNIQRGLTSLKAQPAETVDGHKITLAANIEGPEETDAVIQYGAEGVGLFRSEYLFLSKDKIVDEDEQTEAYKQVASRLAPAPVIIRSLDLGGDKYLPEAHLPKEANPFLGCRSIRLSLMYPEHFKIQLRAILKASAFGKIRLMYPMISSVAQVERANAILAECMDELARKGIPFDRGMEVGVMIEIPSAALTADTIARKVKFFSIGTNDLIQYTIAVDRVNERVASLYEPTHPAVLALIDRTIQAAHRHGIWVGVCGEMGADPVLAPLLVGFGVDELSVAPSAVPLVKNAIRSIRMDQARQLADFARKSESASEILSRCRRLMRDVAPELMELV